MIAVLIIFGAWPLIDGIKKNSEDFILAKNNISTFESQINEIENFKNSYATYQENLQKMDQLFVDSENPVDFIKFLEDSALVSNVSLQVIIPPYSNNKESSLKFVLFQLSLKGEFDDILAFIDRIEFGNYLIEVSNLTIENQKINQNIKKSESLTNENNAFINIKVFAKR